MTKSIFENQMERNNLDARMKYISKSNTKSGMCFIADESARISLLLKTIFLFNFNGIEINLNFHFNYLEQLIYVKSEQLNARHEYTNHS